MTLSHKLKKMNDLMRPSLRHKNIPGNLNQTQSGSNRKISSLNLAFERGCPIFFFAFLFWAIKVKLFPLWARENALQGFITFNQGKQPCFFVLRGHFRVSRP